MEPLYLFVSTIFPKIVPPSSQNALKQRNSKKFKNMLTVNCYVVSNVLEGRCLRPSNFQETASVTSVTRPNKVSDGFQNSSHDKCNNFLNLLISEDRLFHSFQQTFGFHMYDICLKQLKNFFFNPFSMFYMILRQCGSC